MSARVRVCGCVCMGVCECVCGGRVYECECMCVQEYVRACVWTCMSVSACGGVYESVCGYECVGVYVWEYECECVCMCRSVCVSASVCVGV